MDYVLCRQTQRIGIYCYCLGTLKDKWLVCWYFGICWYYRLSISTDIDPESWQIGKDDAQQITLFTQNQRPYVEIQNSNIDSIRWYCMDQWSVLSWWLEWFTDLLAIIVTWTWNRRTYWSWWHLYWGGTNICYLYSIMHIERRSTRNT